ncbi:MAG: flippase-like domain-containing protein [Candidatus Latescibacteria bacterium]|nr:flippase-like domain-containing protein [Candidatus Latescibacterota bacterium]
MKGRRLALAALGLGLSAAAVVLLLREVSAKDLLLNLRHADPWWFLGACGVTVFGYYLRARRWLEILAPEARVPLSRLFAATMVGFLAINTLPARLGEFVRAFVLARSERLRTATVLGSVVIERIFDLAALGAFWAMSLLFAPYPDWFRWSGYATLGLGLVVTATLWLLHAGHYHQGSLGARLGAAIPTRILAPFAPSLATFTAGLRAFGNPRALARAGAATAAMWLVNGTVFLLVGASMGLSLPYWAPFLLSFVVCVAITIPSSPGFIGVLEGSCVVGLALLGVDAPRALAYGVLYHLTQIAPLVLLGSFYAARSREAARTGEKGFRTPGGG